ncbi:Gfo/Idh/MocA family protein [Halomicrobium urmianum]|uniref:Gfo/Idh/MocA family protein n=1 Tax=Halomicrobium urmianum TaxID=1586233 RepID=UPI001CD9B394|nr:Gfo/Idh/MocA family oxidoreductase [Halomicrobium urmianum]
MVSVCLLGAGFMAEMHCGAYDYVEDVDVTAVVSPNSADAFVEEQGLDATAFSDVETALSEADVDAVDVCTPTHTHREHVERAVEAGLPVVCEKPLAPTLADAAAVRETVAGADVPVMVAHVLRYFPQYAAARDQVADGRIGAAGVARARRLSPFPDWAEWYADRESSGGVFLDLAIHDFDFLRWTVGEVERVFARRTREDGLEHGTATLSFEDGSTGYVEASWAQPGSRELEFELELAGDEGVVSYDSGDDAPVRLWTGEAASDESPAGPADGYVRELRHFVDCVRSGATPDVDVDAAIEAMRISKAAERSAERGEPVAVAEVTADGDDTAADGEVDA